MRPEQRTTPLVNNCIALTASFNEAGAANYPGIESYAARVAVHSVKARFNEAGAANYPGMATTSLKTPPC